MSRVSGSEGSNPSLPAAVIPMPITFVMSVREEMLAWAAGLYDGEGSSSMFVPRQRKTARRQIQVSQAGPTDAIPVALVRFREIVGEGSITGPYRGYLYYWKTTRKHAVDKVATDLWPYLGDEKRRQFMEMSRAARWNLERLLPAQVRLAETERAWAAGLFDGEGSISVSRRRSDPSWRGLGMELPQSSGDGVPAILGRFAAAVSVGSVSGARRSSSGWSRLPQYRWQVSGRHQVSTVVKVLWQHLGPVKRVKIAAHRDLLDVDCLPWEDN